MGRTEVGDWVQCGREFSTQEIREISGRGLARPGRRYRSTPRLVLIKPLHKDCRRLLCAGPLAGGIVQ
jgi:hypothetical protein